MILIRCSILKFTILNWQRHWQLLKIMTIAQNKYIFVILIFFCKNSDISWQYEENSLQFS
jgi:hypothetical protein